MDLQYLNAFNQVAIEESFTRAAEKLHISQPAVSIQIKKLEEGLGVTLFDRLNNKIYLNNNGKILFEATRKIFDIAEKAEKEITNSKDKIGGVIRIGGSNSAGTYILPKVLGEFKRMYPETIINLKVGNTAEIADLVDEGDLDFAVNGGNITYAQEIFVEKLIDDPVVLCVSPSNPLAGRVLEDVRELESMDFIAHVVNSRMYKLATDIIGEIGVRSKITMTVGSIDAIKQAVEAGLGIGPLSKISVESELSYGVISEIKIKGKSWTYPYKMIYNKNKYLTPAAKKLMEMVHDWCANRKQA